MLKFSEKLWRKKSGLKAASEVSKPRNFLKVSFANSLISQKKVPSWEANLGNFQSAANNFLT